MHNSKNAQKRSQFMIIYGNLNSLDISFHISYPHTQCGMEKPCKRFVDDVPFFVVDSVNELFSAGT